MRTSVRLSIVVASLAVVTGAVGVLGSLDGGKALPTNPASASGSVAATQLIDQPVFRPDRVRPVDTVAAVTWDGPGQVRVLLLSTATGEVLAEKDTDYHPMVLLRRTANEVLVSHLRGERFMLDVLDAGNGLALKRTFPMPDRVDYKVYTNVWATLSKDERFLAYSTQTMRTELPGCRPQPGVGINGPSCARNGVRVIDLDSPTPAEWHFELARYCGPGFLHTFESAGIAVTCSDGATYVFRQTVPSPVSGPATPRFETDPVIQRNLARGLFATSSDNGWYATLLSEGSFVWADAGMAERNFMAVPPGKQPRWPHLVETGDGRLVLGYVTRYYDQIAEGFAVFDMAQGVIERTFEVPDVMSIVAAGPTRLLALTTDAALIEIDVRTGNSLELTRLPLASGSNTVLVR